MEEQKKIVEKTFIVHGRSASTCGILINKDPDEWINFAEKKSGISKIKMQEQVGPLNKGDEIKATMFTNSSYIGFEVTKKAAPGKQQGRSLDNMPSFDDTLKKFNGIYKNYSKSTTREIIQQEKGIYAIAHVTITLKDGRTRDGLGEASTKDLTEHLKDSVLRMSETRAFARCMRWFLGETTIQEECSKDEPKTTYERINQDPQQ